MDAPPLNIDPTWEAFWPFPALVEGRSFISGRQAGDRMRVVYFRRADDDRLLARAWFGPGAEGPPSHAHGGAIAAVLDEAMGGACWMHGHAVLAARLTVTYLRPVPLGTDATVEAWIHCGGPEDLGAGAHARRGRPRLRRSRWPVRGGEGGSLSGA